MLVASAFLFLLSLLSAVFTVRARMWPRVVLNHVRILIVEDRHWWSVRFADVRAARWVRRPKLGRLELVTESDRCRIEFSHVFFPDFLQRFPMCFFFPYLRLQDLKRQELIYLLRNCLPEEIQEGWEAFQGAQVNSGDTPLTRSNGYGYVIIGILLLLYALCAGLQVVGGGPRAAIISAVVGVMCAVSGMWVFKLRRDTCRSAPPEEAVASVTTAEGEAGSPVCDSGDSDRLSS